MPSFQQSTTSTSGPAVQRNRRGRRRGSTGDNSTTQDQLGASTTRRDETVGPSPDDALWGDVIEAESGILAPYRAEILLGEVAVPGQRDGAVDWLQDSLLRLGFELSPSSLFDGPTEAALEEWQRLNGLAVTGELGLDTLKALEQALKASISLAQFKENAPGVDEATLREYLPHLNASMLKADITSDTRKAVYIAQLGHESDGFGTLEEYASGRRYEGRRDLGNTQAGDGRRFKGRGPIQITGRYNYGLYGDAVGVDLLNRPELAATPEVGFQVTAEYWKRNELNGPADRGRFNTVTQRINGGQNGKADRRRRWSIAKRSLRRQDDRRDDIRTDELAAIQGPTTALDGVLAQIGAGEYAAAVEAAEAQATRAHEAGEDPVLASRARDIARAMLDGDAAYADERFGDSKEAAGKAARLARELRDQNIVNGGVVDPVLTVAGALWTRARDADEARGSSADLALVESALPLRQGARGPAVAALQRLLQLASADGVFGPATDAAIKRFQRDRGLAPDGVVGPGTLAQLGR